jgi:hypothetical protein
MSLILTNRKFLIKDPNEIIQPDVIKIEENVDKKIQESIEKKNDIQNKSIRRKTKEFIPGFFF